MNFSHREAGPRLHRLAITPGSTIDMSCGMHHDALMRTTVDIPENLHRIAIGLARHTGRSLSEAIVDLMRRGLESGATSSAGKPFEIHAATGLPVARSNRPITADDVKAVEDVS